MHRFIRSVQRAVPRGSRALATAAPLQHTALYDLHLELGGKMVPFAGYSLPVQYPKGVLAEHHWTRAADSASLFDVGHMGQLRWYGSDRVAFLERVCCADVAGLALGASSLTLLTLPSGGILDDSIVSNHGDYHYMVVNGATKAKDLAHFDALLRSPEWVDKRVRYEHLVDRNLLAIQGPAAASVLSRLLPPSQASAVAGMAFMSGARELTVAGVPCSVVRCGYTGEDGFEVGMAPGDAETVARALLADQRIAPAALGARDSLRLEAGLCLYGHDIDEGCTPNEATLAWVLQKARREPGRDTFLGAPAILRELRDKAWKKRRVGIKVLGAPAREGARVFAAGAQDPAGVVTSGTFSPCLKAPVAMGYVQPSLSAVGTQLEIEVRGKRVPAVVTPMPFWPTRYHRL